MDASSVKLSQFISHMQYLQNVLPFLSRVPESLKAGKQTFSMSAKDHRSIGQYYNKLRFFEKWFWVQGQEQPSSTSQRCAEIRKQHLAANVFS